MSKEVITNKCGNLCRPGTYQYSLTHLEPNKHYRVQVRAVNPNMFIADDSKDIDDDSLAKAIEFTTQEGGKKRDVFIILT